MMEPLVAYLDHKDWIALGRIKQGKAPDQKHTLDQWNEAYRIVNQAVKDGELRIPISIVNISEIGSSKYRDQQTRLIDTMYEFSRGYVMQPFEVTLDQEMRIMILKQMGKFSNFRHRQSIQKILKLRITKYNPQSTFMGRGITYLIHGSKVRGQLVHKETGEASTDIELNQKMEEGLESIEAFHMFIESHEVVRMYNDSRKNYLGLISSIDKFRNTYLRTQTGTKRDDIAESGYMIFGLSDMITSITMHYTDFFNILIKNEKECMEQIFPDAIQGLPFDQPKTYMKRLLRKMPTAFCLFQLEYYRDKHFQRIITPNDIFDTNALSTAIPYCDAIVCEKFFGRGIQKLGLDEKFNTKVFTNLIGFAEYLKEL